jgi:hypothetical protein
VFRPFFSPTDERFQSRRAGRHLPPKNPLALFIRWQTSSPDRPSPLDFGCGVSRATPLQCNFLESSCATRILECGGRARPSSVVPQRGTEGGQQRHRFGMPTKAIKAAWLPLCGIPAALQKVWLRRQPRHVFTLKSDLKTLAHHNSGRRTVCIWWWLGRPFSWVINTIFLSPRVPSCVFLDKKVDKSL